VIRTVLGDIGAEATGITLPHEHLLIDFKVMFSEPAAAADKERALEPVSLANLGWVRQNFNANLDNLRLLDKKPRATRSCSSSTPAGVRWSTQRPRPSPAILSRWPASPGPPGSMW
jgi:predicted metal-dependent phosphotriesterase family hydrolase